MPADTPLVLREVSNGVATVTLNRPDRMNAWTPGLQEQLFGTLEEFADDPDVRVVVITGAGRGFCVGADTEVLQETDGDGEASSRGLFVPMQFPKPIIAAINGPCAGLGLQLALMCDIRFASKTAKFTTAFARRGLIAEHGLTWLLPRVTTMANALDLLMTARVFTGAEAKDLGVVNFAVEPEEVLDKAREFAQDLADNVSPTAMGVIKWQVYNHTDMPLWPSMNHSDELMVESIRRDDFKEGVASFVEKRKPNFAPLDRSAIPDGPWGEFEYTGGGLTETS